MLLYETLILSSTHVTNDEFSLIEDFFDKLMAEAGGMVKSFDKWGKYRLAYPVKKNDYGIYTLIRFELPEGNIASIFKKLDSFFKIKCSETVLRSVTKKLESSRLEYKKPEPVDSRSRNLDTFLKENKMESLLNGNYSSKKQPEVSKDKNSSKEKREESSSTIDSAEETKEN